MNSASQGFGSHVPPGLDTRPDRRDSSPGAGVHLGKVTITLFATPTCPHCRTARTFLAEQGVAYLERDVTRDYLALRDLLFLLGRADVPALYVGYEAAVGFDREVWLRILAHGRELEATGDPYALPEVFGDDPIKL